ncbi:MAG: hypothetical protein AVDCRST_MAG35-2499 [uncultured Quadrisphaera sp.]|uniref:Uncharacterized protein n=1 Tax=uncultured Quadrisphaera sp. TaxID=904978 RepID=A0A6J4Q6G5_9ACTN|nr:MAG: hypothetical protein AVDCRST_MAG35-2499 [uncultured Quadrisphaera sp.]
MSAHRPAPTTQQAIDARKEQIGDHLESHGHSRAAWTGVGVVILGALIASIGTVAAALPVFWVGMVVMAAGGPIGWFLGKRGHGAKTMQGGQGEKKVVS